MKNILQGHSQVISAIGPPYNSENFKNGKIVNTVTQKIENGRLRYDILHDRIQIRIGNTNKVRFLPKNEKIAYIIGDQKFIYGQFQNDRGKEVKGYFEEIYINAKIRLLRRHKAEIIPAQLAVTGYEKPKKANIEKERQYYIIQLDGMIKVLKFKKKDIRNVLNTKKLDDYLELHRIKDENDFIRLLEILHC